MNVTELENAQRIALGLACEPQTEYVPLDGACGRILASDICAMEDVPGFIRSTVDGYALRAADTFGCSEALPALFSQGERVRMGECAGELGALCAAYVPTGGELPAGADAVVMQENTGFFLDELQVFAPVAPGQNVIFRGDDVSAGDNVYSAGTRLLPKDIGALAALGTVSVPVTRRPRIGIISTGDEIVGIDCPQQGAVVRDVNTHALAAAAREAGGEPVLYGIVKDDDGKLDMSIKRANEECDITVISGGSSVGEKDAAARLIGARGEILLHGIAVKPGKPTIIGRMQGRAVFGLPGHPMAAYFMFLLLVRPLIQKSMGADISPVTVQAVLVSALPSNHGREELVPVAFVKGEAMPVRGKSGLITTLCGANGYIRVPRGAEGICAGERVTVYLF